MKTTKLSANSLLLEGLRTSETKLIADMAREFNKVVGGTNPKINRSIIDFARMKTNFCAYRKFQSKRKLEMDLKSRISLIRSIQRQLKRDKGYFENPYSNDFLDRYLFMALVEKAILVAEDLNKNDPRDTLAFGFHLWNFKKLLVSQNVDKPVETLAVILEKTRATEGIGRHWSARTIYNKISKVQELIATSKRLGACHEPSLIGDYLKVESPRFIKSISGGCAKCMKAWKVAIKINQDNESPFEIAAKDLSKKVPKLSRPIASLLKSTGNMPLEDLLDRTPNQLRGILTFVTG